MGEARGAAGVMRIACKTAHDNREKNFATYGAKIRERKKELELAHRRAMKHERQAHARNRDMGLGTRGGGRASAKGAELPAEEQQRLQRVLVATRMSSLVLLAAKDDNIEQVRGVTLPQYLHTSHRTSSFDGLLSRCVACPCR